MSIHIVPIQEDNSPYFGQMPTTKLQSVWNFFSCPSSSIPTPEITWLLDYLINGLEFSFKTLTKPYQTITNHPKFQNFDQISQLWPNFRIPTQFQKSDQNSKIWLEFWNLVRIVRFGQNSEIWYGLWWFGMVWYGLVNVFKLNSRPLIN